MNTSFIQKIYFEDDKKIYKVGTVKNRWRVEQIDLEAAKAGNGKEYIQIADSTNNPKQKACPKTLEEVKTLNYRY